MTINLTHLKIYHQRIMFKCPICGFVISHSQSGHLEVILLSGFPSGVSDSGLQKMGKLWRKKRPTSGNIPTIYMATMVLTVSPFYPEFPIDNDESSNSRIIKFVFFPRP